jgi:peptidyl-prolyl cis-trans isomerase SurA
MKSYSRISVAAALLATCFWAPINAQTVADDTVPEALLDIPGGQQLFAVNNPNVRRATAIVNGEIITGTDIDHRLALILEANKNPITPAEVQRLRGQIVTNLIDETLQIQEAKAFRNRILIVRPRRQLIT